MALQQAPRSTTHGPGSTLWPCLPPILLPPAAATAKTGVLLLLPYCPSTPLTPLGS